jgi:putative hydrolase of the HAD superfamily
LKPIRAVLFDIGDTLWHSQAAPPAEAFRRLAAQRCEAILREFGIRHSDPNNVARTAWRAMEDAMKRARETDLIEPDYGAVTQIALGALAIRLSRGRSARLLEATYISGIEGGKAAFDDAVPTLMELRQRGFLLAAVTNRAFGGERFRTDLREAGLDIGWDAESVSVEVGFLKPHPALFNHALTALGASPGEALMVGNSLAEDIAGAQDIGMRAAWRRSPPDSQGVTPDFTFDELSELLEYEPLRGGPGGN